LNSAELVAFSFFLGPKTLKWDENSVSPAYVIGITQDYGPLFNITIAEGRYFTDFESEKGQPVAVIGNVLAGKLFGAVDPVGRDIQVMGKQIRIIGVIEKEGESILRVAEFDDALLLPIEFGRQLANIKGNGFNTFIGLRPFKGADFESFKDEVAFNLRSKRRIRPYEDNSFATNEIKLIQALLDSVFSILNLAGFLIGIFAIIVGMFSVANIMFVSVKERTNLIGIKKAIGATKMVILLEILIESVLLCLAGGVVGLILVGLLMLLASYAFEFNMYLSFYNAFTGVLMSVVVGILSGMIPAIQASNLDPVEAIRQ
jgi:putative ABC transport system permease protein